MIRLHAVPNRVLISFATPDRVSRGEMSLDQAYALLDALSDVIAKAERPPEGLAEIVASCGGAR